jgi:phosphatidate cytidylyltransferase
MLRWRIVLGTLIVAGLAGLCWLDHRSTLPGVWLFVVAVALAVLAGEEILDLMAAGGLRPVRWIVHAGNLALVAGTWLPVVCCELAGGVPAGARPAVWDGPVGSISWHALALAAGATLAFLGEMRRYEKPGGVTANLAGSVFAMVYVGLLLGFVVRLRLGWGIPALASLVIVVKMGDVGAFAVGRLIGRHRLAPVLSPGKTIEGAIGALVFATFGAWVVFSWLVPWLARTCPSECTPESFRSPGAWHGWLLFGLVVGVVGMLGDLAESLVKRDVGQKDSSRWMPGFGGVLDILDSILLAAPVVYVFWACEIVHP